MAKDGGVPGAFVSASQQPAIKFLVESALRRVKSSRELEAPRSRKAWVDHFARTLISDSETSHRSAIAALIANGVQSREVYDFYIPASARRLGELWVSDRVSFVEVTIGAARLQALFRDRPDDVAPGGHQTIPLGQTVLMAIPAFEEHSLGAFVAADQLRRHGLWVHMGIGLTAEEIGQLVEAKCFSLVGISVATPGTLEKVTEVVDYLRSNLEHVPPIVIGGRAVTDLAKVTEQTGADLAVRTAREAVEKCGLSTVGSSLLSETRG